MALVKCSECNHLVSNQSLYCPNCGYTPKGNCSSCKYYKTRYGFSSGRCMAIKSKIEMVKNDKSICPAVIKRDLF